MNKAKLKTYAPQARKDFIAAVTARAHRLGLSEENGQLQVSPAEKSGDLVIIAGQSWPAKISRQREQLIALIEKDGFSQTMEAVAYTWFNRFAALRYMEIHDYLNHGYRVLSSREGGLPEILGVAPELAQNGELPGLNPTQVVELKLAGDQDGELYRLTLIAQCNALSRAMPFLFERIDNETELLLPDNLLLTDSVIAKLVTAIPEEDWSQVEIIGWLYQFYISEKKDQVIGKVVKSEDIPAATQLFTPNWIVQYLVQNSVGRLWLMANPASTLKSAWPYYIEPAEQTPEVQAQLDALIQTRINEDSPLHEGEGQGVRGSLNPETLTVLDPACGSGHILVVAYDVLKAIYLERGYQARAIPRLILEKNLYGLDIDDRAAQMAGFALLMKARADDRRLFNEPPKLNVLSLQESKGLDAAELAEALQPGRHSREVGSPVANDFAPDDLFPGTRPQMTLGESVSEQAPDTFNAKCATNLIAARARSTRATGQNDAQTGASGSPQGQTRPANVAVEVIASLITTFEHAKTFGSLLQIVPQRTSAVRELLSIVNQSLQSGDLYAQAAAQDLLPLVQQALVLGMQFDAVVANPPYMGGKGMNVLLKDFAQEHFPDSKADLFACFIERSYSWVSQGGRAAMVTLDGWMFLASYVKMRESITQQHQIDSLVHVGWNCFPFGHTYNRGVAFTALKAPIDLKGTFLNLSDVPATVEKDRLFEARKASNEKTYHHGWRDFQKIPGNPVAYWVSEELFSSFENGVPLKDLADPKKGLATTDNDRFLRRWFEVPFTNIGFSFKNANDAAVSELKWFPLNKGGSFRKWYGNKDYIINWYNNGEELKAAVVTRYGGGSYTKEIRSEDKYFLDGITWSALTSGDTSFRYTNYGALFDSAGSTMVPKSNLGEILGILNGPISREILEVINPTINYGSGSISNIPIILTSGSSAVNSNVDFLIDAAVADWNSYERSCDFKSHPICTNNNSSSKSLESSFNIWIINNITTTSEVKRIEEENNKIFIDAYGLRSELSPEVPIDKITLTVNPEYRYGPGANDEARTIRFREDTICELVSYAIGCMMGRYSLDEPGLIYAHTGNAGFEPDRYDTFPADADGIVPITDELWFEDDAANRIREFLLAVWGTETLDENIVWLAESLGQKTNETPEETIRRYLADKFFKDHLQTYKKRPIYWLFSSGKQGAFQALAYLHRYHEGTLARMRAEYVVPLTGKIQSRIEMLKKDADAATSNAARNKLNKDIEKLKKKHVELLAYDEKLRHYADLRIQLDLDDGVKVNYGKFGDLLAEVKAVTGGTSDD